MLKNGKAYEGTIVEQTDALVKIRTAKATLSFQMDQVASVEKGEWALGELEKRLSALDPSKPGAYLDAARYMAGPGREGFDLPTFLRLCEIASSLDQGLAFDAQTLLAKELGAAGEKRAASRAMRRALVARPGDAGTLRALEPLNKEVVRLAELQMKNLVTALDEVLCDSLDLAAPKLQPMDPALMPEDVLRELKVPFEKFTADIRSRVRCKTCAGQRILKCPGCVTPGENVCKACAGQGRTPAAVAKNDPEAKFGETVCLACHGVGLELCKECKATRQITIEFKPIGKKPKSPVVVNAEAGREAEAINKVVDPKTWRSREDGGYVSGIVAGSVKGGGEITCPACQGAIYSPPMTPIDSDSVQATRDAASKYVEGLKTWDPLGFEPAAYDQDVVRDGCFRRQKGKWVK